MIQNININNFGSLISANPAYEPRRYSGNELEEISVEGKDVACYHKF
jgi:hypothetical protein